MYVQISEILRNKDVNGSKTKQSISQRKTIFADILDSKLPPEELTTIRLQHEAISVVGAALETTKWALTVATYHILANPSISTRLQLELERAIPDPQKIPSWSELQKLPYLSACIEEGNCLHPFLIKFYEYLCREIFSQFVLCYLLIHSILFTSTFTMLFAIISLPHLKGLVD